MKKKSNNKNNYSGKTFRLWSRWLRAILRVPFETKQPNNECSAVVETFWGKEKERKLSDFCAFLCVALVVGKPQALREGNKEKKLIYNAYTLYEPKMATHTHTHRYTCSRTYCVTRVKEGCVCHQRKIEGERGNGQRDGRHFDVWSEAAGVFRPRRNPPETLICKPKSPFSLLALLFFCLLMMRMSSCSSSVGDLYCEGATLR